MECRYKHRWTRLASFSLLGHYSVANSSYNEFTKSNPKICQIYTKFISVTKTFNLMLLFLQYLFIISCRWLTVALCDHRDAATSIFTFLTLTVTILLSTRKFIIPTQCIFLSFVIQNTFMLCNSCQLSFCTIIRRHTQNQLDTSLQATPAQSGTLSQIFCHSRMQLSHIWIHFRLTKPHA